MLHTAPDYNLSCPKGELSRIHLPSEQSVCVYKQEIYQKYAVKKGEGIMRIAVTYENGQIFQHFGHTETFKTTTGKDIHVVSMDVEATVVIKK